MDPQPIFCHNPDCPASGKVGRGNIGVHSRKRHRYICHGGKRTFTQTQGTVNCGATERAASALYSVFRQSNGFG